MPWFITIIFIDQKFNINLNSIDFDALWFHVIKYRYHDYHNSNFLQKELLSKSKILKMSSAIGFGICCIYNDISNN